MEITFKRSIRANAIKNYQGLAQFIFKDFDFDSEILQRIGFEDAELRKILRIKDHLSHDGIYLEIATDIPYKTFENKVFEKPDKQFWDWETFPWLAGRVAVFQDVVEFVAKIHDLKYYYGVLNEDMIFSDSEGKGKNVYIAGLPIGKEGFALELLDDRKRWPEGFRERPTYFQLDVYYLAAFLLKYLCGKETVEENWKVFNENCKKIKGNILAEIIKIAIAKGSFYYENAKQFYDDLYTLYKLEVMTEKLKPHIDRIKIETQFDRNKIEFDQFTVAHDSPALMIPWMSTRASVDLFLYVREGRGEIVEFHVPTREVSEKKALIYTLSSRQIGEFPRRSILHKCFEGSLLIEFESNEAGNKQSDYWVEGAGEKRKALKLIELARSYQQQDGSDMGSDADKRILQLIFELLNSYNDNTDLKNQHNFERLKKDKILDHSTYRLVIEQLKDADPAEWEKNNLGRFSYYPDLIRFIEDLKVENPSEIENAEKKALELLNKRNDFPGWHQRIPAMCHHILMLIRCHQGKLDDALHDLFGFSEIVFRDDQELFFIGSHPEDCVGCHKLNGEYRRYKRPEFDKILNYIDKNFRLIKRKQYEIMFNRDYPIIERDDEPNNRTYLYPGEPLNKDEKPFMDCDILHSIVADSILKNETVKTKYRQYLESYYNQSATNLQKEPVSESVPRRAGLKFNSSKRGLA